MGLCLLRISCGNAFWGQAFLPSFPRRSLLRGLNSAARRPRVPARFSSRPVGACTIHYPLSIINYPSSIIRFPFPRAGSPPLGASSAEIREIRGRFFPPTRSELRRTGDDEKLLRRSPFSSASRPLPDALTVCGGGFLVSCESSFPEASAPFEDKTPSKERTPFSP